MCGRAARTDLRGRRDVTRVSILEPAFPAVHESAVGTSSAMRSPPLMSAIRSVPHRNLPRRVSGIGATSSLPRTPAKVSSPSDLQTFVIVHCKTDVC